jgi:hypothetical protein
MHLTQTLTGAGFLFWNVLQVHDATRPWDCFSQFTDKQVLGSHVGKKASQLQPGLLTRAAQACLQAMVAAYQQAAAAAASREAGSRQDSGSSGSRGVRFVLHGGDGLALCGPGSSLGDGARFDAIDVSNVGDHAGG